MIPLNSNLSALKRSQIRTFTNLARETPGCAMLTIGEPDFDTPKPIKAAAIIALQMGQTHYAPNQGTLKLRQAISEFETDRGNPVPPEQVLVTVGACQALFTAFLGILNPGEEVIVPTPALPLAESLLQSAGAGSENGALGYFQNRLPDRRGGAEGGHHPQNQGHPHQFSQQPHRYGAQ